MQKNTTQASGKGGVFLGGARRVATCTSLTATVVYVRDVVVAAHNTATAKFEVRPMQKKNYLCLYERSKAAEI